MSHDPAAISVGSATLNVLSVPDTAPVLHKGLDSEGSEPEPGHQMASSVYPTSLRSDLGENSAAMLRKMYKLHHSAAIQVPHRLRPIGWSECCTGLLLADEQSYSWCTAL